MVCRVTPKVFAARATLRCSPVVGDDRIHLVGAKLPRAADDHRADDVTGF